MAIKFQLTFVVSQFRCMYGFFTVSCIRSIFAHKKVLFTSILKKFYIESCRKTNFLGDNPFETNKGQRK